MKGVLKKEVYTLLNLLPKARKSDDFLIRLYAEKNGLSTDLADVAEHITVSDINAITRCRRRHQQEFPNLYPNDIQKIREEERKKYKKEFSK